MSKKKKEDSDVSPYIKNVGENLPTSKNAIKSVKTSLATKVKTTTPYEIFNYCIGRAENLIKIHRMAHGCRIPRLLHI